MKVDINRLARFDSRRGAKGAHRLGRRSACLWLVVLTASGAHAQAPAPAPDLSLLRELMGQAAQHPEQLDFLRREAERLQACFTQIDPQAREILQVQGDQIAGEVRTLCVKGLREEAQTLALDGVRTLLASPAARELQQCGDVLPQLLTALPLIAATRADGANVCDLNF
jgi:hypothetical protein